MNAKGNKGEIYFINWCIQHGLQVSLPYGGQQSYDVVVDIGSRLLRAQVKTVEDRVLRENGYHIDLIQRSGLRYTAVDIFVICIYRLGYLYIIPAEECKHISISINPYSSRSKYNKYLASGLPEFMRP